MRLRTEDLTWQEIDEEVVVLDLKASTYLKLNGTGALLWKELDRGAELADLVQQLTSTYAVSFEQAREDVVSFLRQLAHAKLLESAPGSD